MSTMTREERSAIIKKMFDPSPQLLRSYHIEIERLFLDQKIDRVAQSYIRDYMKCAESMLGLKIKITEKEREYIESNTRFLAEMEEQQ